VATELLPGDLAVWDGHVATVVGKLLMGGFPQKAAGTKPAGGTSLLAGQSDNQASVGKRGPYVCPSAQGATSWHAWVSNCCPVVLACHRLTMVGLMSSSHRPEFDLSQWQHADDGAPGCAKTPAYCAGDLPSDVGVGEPGVSESAGVTAVRCDVCGYEYPNPTQAAAEPPGTPCPECGATTGRHRYIAASDSIQISEFVEYKGKHAGEKKHYIEIQDGAQLRVSEGDYVHKFRRIDRDYDEYEENLTDLETGEILTDPETGEAIRDVREPLSEHWGHGSAKSRNP
jgi:hypothetical protein